MLRLISSRTFPTVRAASTTTTVSSGTKVDHRVQQIRSEMVSNHLMCSSGVGIITSFNLLFLAAVSEASDPILFAAGVSAMTGASAFTAAIGHHWIHDHNDLSEQLTAVESRFQN